VMYEGETFQLQTAMVEVATKAPEDVEWESSNPDAVLVSANGLLTAVKKGSATITATYEGVKKTFTASCEVTVSVELTGIQINPEVIDMNLTDADVAVSVVPVPADAQVDAAKVVWTVEDGTIATVSAGKLHPLKGGATVLRASYHGLEASANVVIRSDSFKGMLPYMKNNYFPITWKSDMSNLTALTMECLVYAKGYEGLSTLFGKEGEWLVRYGDIGYNPGQLQLALSGDAGGNFPSASVSPDLAKNTWYHVAAVWNAATGTRIFYINGENRVSDTGAKGSVNLTSDSYVGFSYDDGRFFDGYMAEMRIWNVERTEQQIVDNMLSLKEENPQGLVAYWKFNESAGNEVHDYSGNDNNITSKHDLVWEDAGEIVLPKRFALSGEGAAATVRVKKNVTSVDWFISADEEVTWKAEIAQNVDNLASLTTSGNKITLSFPENNTDVKRVYQVKVSTTATVERPEMLLQVTQTGNVIEAQRVTGTLDEGRYVVMLNYYDYYYYVLTGAAERGNFGGDEDADNYLNRDEGYITNIQNDVIWNFSKSGDKWVLRPASNQEKAMNAEQKETGWQTNWVPVLSDTPYEFTIEADGDNWKILYEGQFMSCNYSSAIFTDDTWDEPVQLYKVQ